MDIWKIITIFIVIIAIFAVVLDVSNVGFFSLNNSPETIKVGVILPLTGSNSADAGIPIKKGLDLALEELDKGNTDYKIELVYEDSQYDSKVAVQAIQKLLNIDKIKFIIGEAGSSQTLAIAPIAEQNKIILISTASQSDKVSTAGDYIFRTQSNVSQEAEFFAPYLKEQLGNKSLAIIGMNTDYGKSYSDAFTRVFTNLGGNIKFSELYDKDEKDFKTILSKIDAASADAILIAGLREPNGMILKQAKELNLIKPFYATSATQGKEFLQIAGDSAEGLIYAYPFDETSNIISMKSYQEKFSEKYGESSDMLSANAYDALILLNTCFKEVGTDPDNVKTCLYNTKDYKGASGILTFDANGDVKKNFVLKTVKNGKFVKLS
ncbi:MAG: penicillin-binding protein activator [Candidatus ainarchaeum sp.]|nr:penicillin-binding protein activator [Candidatus ainarchaeum sp.]